MTAVCLQVRLDSTRLPGKALMKIEDLTIIEHAMRALKGIEADKFLLLTTEECLEALSPYSDNWGFDLFAGPKEDVLKRFLLAARKYNISTVIRATGDNPLVSAQVANQVLKEHRSGGFDYSNWTDAPLGTGIEIVETDALERAADETAELYDHEHVTPWIYNNPDRFDLNIHQVPDQYLYKCKVSVDTQDDLDEMKKIFSQLYREEPIEIDRLVEYLKGNLLIPATEQGVGMGHLKRMISLAEKLAGRNRLYIKKEHLDRILPAVPENLHGSIISEIDNPTLYHRIIIDGKETDPDFFRESLKGGNVIALDEGGDLRSEIPYLIDILPLPSRYSSPNIRSLSFLDLPRREKRNDQGKILLTFGGEDPAGLTSLVCGEILKENPELAEKITVVLGPLYKGAEPDPSFTVLRSPSTLQNLIPQCSGVITSFGITAYEVLNQKIPLLLVNPSDYHEELAEIEGFHSAGTLFSEKKKLFRFIDDPAMFSGIDPDFSGPSIADYINDLGNPSPCCPMCHSEHFEIVERFAGKTYCRCKDCSMLFMLKYKKEKMDYGEEYFFEQYEEQYGKTYLDDFDHIKSMAGERLKIAEKYIEKKQAVLDVGCAYGPFLKKAEEMGFIPYGTDISADAAAYINDQLGFSVRAVPFEEFSIPAEWPVDKFGLITMWYVIEHFTDLKKVLEKVNSLLAKGGIFAFSTPNGKGISSRTSARTFLQNSPDDHFSIWEPEHSAKILSLYGFKIEKIRVTGHHPERFRSSLAKSSSGRKMLDLYSRIKGLGDTYEIYARKVRDI